MRLLTGTWVTPHDTKQQDIVDPSTETVVGQVTLGNERDVNDAVAAAKKRLHSVFAVHRY
ncbi:aldehyde dehydrogenase family protein [Tropicibacter sp. Alg240-R139]|uniref:aldehyde dehydrogenase family protein n=1 Tax=Tropicibacter sp. Alg240-R139 TaxID=2305991 RepID=UPI0019681936